MEDHPPLRQPPIPPPPPSRRAASHPQGIRLVALIVLALALGLGSMVLWRVLAAEPDGVQDPIMASRAIEPRGDLADDEKATIELFKERSASVVFITTADIRRDALNINVTEIPRGTGTGVVWSDDGHIVTNFHVIEGADRARVAHGDKAWTARLVGAYPDKDLAVLRIDSPPDSLRPVPCGTSRDLLVGQKVFAIGNPFGLDQTLTTGVISGLGREIKARTGRIIQDVIQTDAAINPGNSGGPLLDSAGRMIGMNTAIYSPSGAYAGIGFAIPVDTVNRIVPQIIEHGHVVRPGFGIQIFTHPILQQHGMEGVLVREVQPGSAAAAAGMLGTVIRRDGNVDLGDIIVTIDGNKIVNSDDLYRVLDRHKVGDTLQVEVLRDARTADTRTETLPVTLQSLD
jgi:S1-C subfamily serine protease